MAVGGRRFSSRAWLLRGISASGRGRLLLQNGQLSLKVHGYGQLWPFQLRKLERACGVPGLADQLEDGVWATVFDVSLANVRVRFPWYTFSGGMHVYVAGVRYRLSFGRPPNNADPTGEEFRKNIDALTSMRMIGKEWRAILGVEGRP